MKPSYPEATAPLILTLKLDEESQAFFNGQRKRYFPPERDYLMAHLLLFHQLPAEKATFDILAGLDQRPFSLQVTGLMNLGAGVAYRVECAALKTLHRLLSEQFREVLIPQDRQGFRPHVTIMNKRTPEAAKLLLSELQPSFSQFEVLATGLDLWTYLGGPWRFEHHFPFC